MGSGPDNGKATELATYREIAPPTVAPIVAPEEEYVKGFDGMAIAPFSAPAVAILREPIDPNDVEIKPDGIVYMPGVFYRSRLNRAFGPGAWAISPRGTARRMPKGGGELVVYHGALFVLGRFVSERMGHCMYYPSNAGMTFADAFEGAITDCVSRCCKDIIPGVEVLWEKGWRDEFQRAYCEKGDDGKWRRKSSSRTSKLNRNAGVQGANGAGAAANASNVAPGQSVSGPPAPPAKDSGSTVSVDKPDPASEAQLDSLERLVFDDCKASTDYASKWLLATFKTNDPQRLTVAQADKAIATFRVDFEKSGGK